jgi:hypothetical protein
MQPADPSVIMLPDLAPPPTSSKAHRRRRARSSGAAKRLVFELIVVFVGVSGAFFVENYRAMQEQERRAQQLYTALSEILHGIAHYGPMIDSQITGSVDEWRQAYDAGERPLPVFYREPRSERPPTGVWHAAVASGAISLMDSELFFMLVQYFNRLDSLGERYVRYNAFTEREVLPLLDLGADAFYTEGTARLQGKHSEHIRRLEEYRDEIRALSAETVKLRDLVDAQRRR